MATIDDIRVEPWLEARHGWRGELISADGASTKDFRRRDVADVLQCTQRRLRAGTVRLRASSV